MAPTRRLAAILAADVAGYSRLMEEDEEGTHAALTALRRDVSDSKIAEHRGRIVKTTGDGLLVEFASVVDAVRCAMAVQRDMIARNATVRAERRIEFRIGINVGDIIVEDGDIHGDGVNIAARLEGIAEPGGICISEDAFRQLRGMIDAEFADIGEQNLRNIARPIRVYRAVPGRLSAAPSPALPLPDKPSIAVLPFQNIGGDHEQEYFADGIVEEIITALSKVRWFFVIARNSSLTYKGRARDVKQIGRELGVRYVLEGSVRKAGHRVRITAQLVEAESGSHVWAERYDRELTDIFAVQDEITESVVATIEPQLYAAENFRIRRKPPENLDAWECVIRALSYIGQGTRAGNTEAEVLCRRAIAIAPAYGQAHSLLAWALARRPMWSGEVRTVLPEAVTEARVALSLDERDPWAHMTHGMVLFRMRRHSEAVRAHRRALELNPNFALAHVLLGLPLAVEGVPEDAVKCVEQALRLAPGDRLVEAYAAHTLKLAYFAGGHYARALASARDALEIYPDSHWAYECIVAAAAMQGDMELAVETLKILLRLQPDFSIAWVLQNSGISGEMRERFIDGLRKAGAPEE